MIGTLSSGRFMGICLTIASLATSIPAIGHSRPREQKPRDADGGHSSVPASPEAIQQLIVDLQKPLSGGAVHKVAVLDLTDLDGNCSALGRYLAEELTTGLAASGKVEVVERNRLRQVLADLNEFTAPDPATYLALQQSLGVDAAVIGTITPLNSIIKINARLVGTERGQVLAAGSVMCAADAGITQLLHTPCKGTPATSPAGSAGTGDLSPSSDPTSKESVSSSEYVPGLWGEYFNLVPSANADNWPDEPIIRRIDPSISFNWGRGSPAGRISANNFAVRWSGQIYCPLAGIYTFAILSDDGCIIRIDARTLVSVWGPAIVRKNVDVRLEAGWHDLRVQYMEAAGGASISISWSKPGDLDFSPITRENYRCLKK